MDLNTFLNTEIEHLKQKNQYRFLRKQSQNSTFINLSSNDYLSIASNQPYHTEFGETLKLRNGIWGSTSSRLLTGNCDEYEILEHRLKEEYQKEAALVFNSGYHANMGILPALMKKGDLILSDKLNHASIVDGLRLSEAEFIRYRHLDYNQIESILSKNRNDYQKVCIVSESVFSMDGDVANLQQLVELKNRYNAILYIDEAHALGVFGDKGLGCAEAMNVLENIDILVGTFGKAFASQGAFAVVSSALREYLINKMRPLIFSTALPPITLMWTDFVFQKIISEEKENRKKLISMSKILHKLLIDNDFENISDSQICPIILGDNATAELKAEQLREAGFLVFAIRPPTVPEGTSRLRISLTTAVNEAEMVRLVSMLKKD